MQRIEGDLIALGRSGRFDVIVHGCNCCHAMRVLWRPVRLRALLLHPRLLLW